MLYEVQNIEEAVALAEELKRRGSHTWFRGQLQNWPLVPSYYRLPDEELPPTYQKLLRFEQWVRMTPGLEELAKNPDAYIAVAQHYGLPTTFIDFTTEPTIAAFFATHGEPPPGGKSYILCWHPADVMDVWESVADALPDIAENPPAFITLDVPNLWRLEAQHGVFFYCPVANFEQVIYDADRIVFPNTGPVKEPTEDRIYPCHKSQLEILLDQYFWTENNRNANEFLKQLLPHAQWYINSSDQGFNAKAFVSGNLPRHPSWDSEQAEQFRQYHVEKFLDIVSDTVWELRLDVRSAEPRREGQRITAEVRQRLLADSNARRRLIRWSVLVAGNTPLGSFEPDFPRAVQLLWDGLRALPYDAEDIAAAIGNCAMLYIAWLRNGRDAQRAASACFGPAFYVDFGSVDGSASRGYAATGDLYAAMREDLAQLLRPEWREKYFRDIKMLLLAVHQPDLLFRFELFKQLFVRQVVPAQALWKGNQMIIFSPTRLTAFGVP